MVKIVLAAGADSTLLYMVQNSLQIFDKIAQLSALCHSRKKLTWQQEIPQAIERCTTDFMNKISIRIIQLAVRCALAL